MMDIRKRKLHARLTVPGNAEQPIFEGSMVEISTQMLQHLTTVSPRDLDSRPITLQILNQPITTALQTDTRKVDEISSLFADGVTEEPFEGEDLMEFVARLKHSGYNEATATVLAYDAFDYPIPADLDRWLNDDRAIKFRAIHASQKNYDDADPEEKGFLANYCRERYPEFVEKMRLKM